MVANINKNWLRKIASKNKKSRLSPKRIYLFLLGLSLTIGDYKLILATSIFMASIFFSYKIDRRSFQYYYRYLLNLFNSPNFINKKLVRTITIASIISIFTYFSADIYHEIENKSLAIFVILQTIFTTLGIGFFSKKLFFSSSQQKRSKISNFEQLIIKLDDNSPINRLQAVNQIMNMWHNQQLTTKQINQLEEYFKLLKDIEVEPVILAKIDGSLRKLSAHNSQPLNTNTKISRSNYGRKPKASIRVRETVDIREFN